MRIIITGGSGLIGSTLARDLLKVGHEVIILSRNPTQTKSQVPEGATLVQWDAKTGEGWHQYVDGADAIVNLAGASIAGEGFPPTPWSDSRKQLLLQSRLNAGAAVVDAIQTAKNKPKLLLQSSAVGYYGGSASDAVLLESNKAGHDFLADVCVQWEASTQAVTDLGVRQVSMRIGLVLSMDGGALPIIALPYKLMSGGPLGSGQQYYSWIYLDDVVKAMRFLLESETSENVYNLTAPNPQPQAEFGRTLGKVLSRPHLIPAPAFALKLALGEVATVVLDGQRAVPENLRAAGFSFDYPTLEPALRDLLGK